MNHLSARSSLLRLVIMTTLFEAVILGANAVFPTPQPSFGAAEEAQRMGAVFAIVIFLVFSGIALAVLPNLDPDVMFWFSFPMLVLAAAPFGALIFFPRAVGADAGHLIIASLGFLASMVFCVIFSAPSIGAEQPG